MSVHVSQSHIEVREQLTRVIPLSPPRVTWKSNSGFRCGSAFNPLSHLADST